MKIRRFTHIGAQVIVVIMGVILLSLISVKMKGPKEEDNKKITLVINDTMTVSQFGTVNNIPKKYLKGIFELTTESELGKNVKEFGFSTDQVLQKFTKQLTIAKEFESRNWVLIPLKFVLTIIMLFIVFYLLRKGKINPKSRKILLTVSVLVFGVILGSDPNPMGTVKDAIVLLGTKHIIFPPRLIAFSVFVLMGIIANKFICSWACQFGTLQDLVFRIGHDKETSNLIPHIKVSFFVSNTIRILFFVSITVAAFAFSSDFVGKIDPFKIYNPGKLFLAGGIFTGLILITSLFIYRPWCHFFCPFGLVGWIAEKFSFFKIRVNYLTCIACNKCTSACPSTVMSAILKRDRVIPDCFSCGACTEVCPTKSVTFSNGKRTVPPADKFLLAGNVDRKVVSKDKKN